MRERNIHIHLLVLALLFGGCDDEGAVEMGGVMGGENQAGDVMGGDVMGGDVMGGDVMGGDVMAGELADPFDGAEYSGEWDMKIRLVDVGSIEVDFRVSIESSFRTLDTVELRVLKGSEVSEIVSTASGIDIDLDGSFALSFNEATIPSMFSPTGSDVVVSFTLTGTPKSDGFCGGVTGEVVTLMLPISVSTFGAVPSGSSTIPGSCDDSTQGVVLERLTTCPDLQAGMNVLSSGGYERTFEVILPSNYSIDEEWPLITLWHGFGSSPQEIKDYSELEGLAESEGFVLVVPSSYPDGAVEWDSLSPTDSPDLAFFDDLVFCLSQSFSVDERRIHVTGMSAGGLWTAYLSVFRSEVIASAVGMSSGLIPDYPATVSTPIPYLAAWGGEMDIAYDQDFNILARDLLADFYGHDHFVMGCNHGEEHNWRANFSPWVVRFLLDHPKGIGELPYAAGLPEGVYPDYCEIYRGE